MRTLLIPCTALALTLVAQPTHAGIDWSYLGDKEVKISAGTSTVTFQVTVGGAANSSGIVMYNITASSSAPNDGPPDHFDKTPFVLTLSIVDELARSTLTGNELGTMS